MNEDCYKYGHLFYRRTKPFLFHRIKIFIQTLKNKLALYIKI